MLGLFEPGPAAPTDRTDGGRQVDRVFRGGRALARRKALVFPGFGTSVAP